MHSELIQALFEALNALGNQAKLAEAIGASQGTVSRWLRNTHGMEVGYCLKFAKITGRDPAQVLRWAGHDPADYLPTTLVLSEEAAEIQARVQLLAWHKRRQQLPPELQPIADVMIIGILDVLHNNGLQHDGSKATSG